MTRVYFDSNVFSNLRNGSTSSFQELKRLLAEYGDSISMFFSYAHILDKKKDLSDYKYLDLSYMESLVKDNYLCYDFLAKQTKFYLATPLNVFDNVDSSDIYQQLVDMMDSNILFGEDSSLTLGDFIRSMYSHLNVNFKDLPPEEKEKLIQLYGESDNLFDGLLQFWKNLFRDNLFYRNVRNTSLAAGVPKILNIDSSQGTSSESFRTSFFDHVTSQLTKTADGNYYYYDYHIQAYYTLDALGISKDKITVKNGFNNLFNDAMHSYYARFSDYLVTADKSFYDKTKLLYELTGVSTKVLLVNEFIELLPKIDAMYETTFADIWLKLQIDTTAYNEIAHNVKEDSTMTTLLAQTKYLNYFDNIWVLKKKTIILFSL